VTCADSALVGLTSHAVALDSHMISIVWTPGTSRPGARMRFPAAERSGCARRGRAKRRSSVVLAAGLQGCRAAGLQGCRAARCTPV